MTWLGNGQIRSLSLAWSNFPISINQRTKSSVQGSSQVSVPVKLNSINTHISVKLNSINTHISVKLNSINTHISVKLNSINTNISGAQISGLEGFN